MWTQYEEGQNQERKIMIKRMAANNFSIPQIANLYQMILMRYKTIYEISKKI